MAKHKCPACGKGHAPLNTTAIASKSAWVRIDLSDAEISQLASGCYRIAVVKVED